MGQLVSEMDEIVREMGKLVFDVDKEMTRISSWSLKVEMQRWVS